MSVQLVLAHPELRLSVLRFDCIPPGRDDHGAVLVVADDAASQANWCWQTSASVELTTGEDGGLVDEEPRLPVSIDQADT